MPRSSGNTESCRDALLESLRNPDEAAHYLTACLEDGDAGVFLFALRDVAGAHGGIRTVSQSAQLNRESLSAALNAYRLRLAVQSATLRKGRRGGV